ncbi:MAG: hypothetical protein ABIH82_02780 [Candidatus Woesearchaeota archaeon]
MTLVNKIKKLLVGTLGLLALTPSTAYADFYDGCRGPNKAQIHYTATASEDGLEHSLIGKYFGDNLFAVGAINTDGKDFTGGFAGLGYIFEHFDRVKVLPVLGYAVSGDGKQGTAVGIAQATIFLDEDGTFLLDPRYTLAVPAHGHENHTPQHTLGLTASVGNSRIRVGSDLSYVVGENPVVSGLLRYDLDAEKHSSWVQVGLSSDGSAQVQFRGNF